MKIGIDKTPNIMQIVFRAEPSDKIYSNCMRGVINLDLKNKIMSACTDCGVYAYKWNGKGKEFLKLVKTVDEEYLLAKISTKEFDYALTVSKILKYLFFNKDEDRYLKAVDFFNCLDDMLISRQREFYDVIERYDCEGVFIDLDIDDFVVYNYPSRARTFANLFVKCVQPRIEI